MPRTSTHIHTLKSLVQEHEMAEDGFRATSKGTKFTKIPGVKTLMGGSSKVKNRSTPESLLKYEQFFTMIHQDAQYSKGVTLNQLPNPVSGVVDIVQVTFDLRAIQAESMMAQRNAMGTGANMQSAMNNAITNTAVEQQITE